jgi:hypothetical protein
MNLCYCEISCTNYKEIYALITTKFMPINALASVHYPFLNDAPSGWWDQR